MPLFDQTGTKLHPELPSDASSLFSPDGTPENPLHEQAALNMADYLSANDIDVVLAQYGPTGVAMLKPCGLANVPLVTHFHGFDATLKPVLTKYAMGYDLLFDQATHLIAVSSAMEQDLIQLGAPKNKLTVNPYGVNSTLFSSSAPGKAGPHFVAVGRFVAKKAPDSLVRTFAKVVQDIPEATMTMIGDGVLRETCVRLADELGIADKISFPGQLSHAEVAGAMRKARCFVQHSVTPESGDKEGTPNSVLEASASGLPVVSTRHAGIPEAVVHGKTGLLCEEGDETAMAENMIAMLKNAEQADRLGQAGKRHVKTMYDFNDRLEKLYSILNNAKNDEE